MNVFFYEYSLFRRYFRGKDARFISFMTTLATLGVVLGVAALIIVLSVMNGFEEVLKKKIVGTIADASLIKHGEPILNWTAFVDRWRLEPHVKGFSPYIQGQGLLKSSHGTAGVVIQGIDPNLEQTTSSLHQHIQEGNLSLLKTNRWHALIGNDLAKTLGLHIGDSIYLLTASTGSRQVMGLPTIKQFKISGIFNLGLFEYDAVFVYISLNDAQALFQEPPYKARIKFDNYLAAPRLSAELQKKMDPSIEIIPWTETHASFFKAVQTEKATMFIILMLIVTVATFNIVSSVFMLITQKEADIAILKTMGASPASIMCIFIFQGVMIGLLGTILGCAIGLVTAAHLGEIVKFVEQTCHIHLIAHDVYMIEELPSQIAYIEVFYIFLVSFLLCFLSTLYPAWKACKIQPAITLRAKI